MKKFCAMKRRICFSTLIDRSPLRGVIDRTALASAASDPVLVQPPENLGTLVAEARRPSFPHAVRRDHVPLREIPELRPPDLEKAAGLLARENLVFPNHALFHVRVSPAQEPPLDSRSHVTSPVLQDASV